MTEQIIGAAYQVSNTLGAGFLEKVYENAVAHKLRKRGLIVRQQQLIRVRYDNVVVGEYIADIVVDDEVIDRLPLDQLWNRKSESETSRTQVLI